MLEPGYFPILIAAFGGGMTRGIVGFVKYQFSYKNVMFNIPYFLAMVFLSGVVGVLSAAAVRELEVPLLETIIATPGVAFVVGYAGGDFVENVYKIITRKTSLY